MSGRDGLLDMSTDSLAHLAQERCLFASLLQAHAFSHMEDVCSMQTHLRISCQRFLLSAAVLSTAASACWHACCPLPVALWGALVALGWAARRCSSGRQPSATRAPHRATGSGQHACQQALRACKAQLDLWTCWTRWKQVLGTAIET